ncbi:traC [Symbiodinium microadriaticum]|nr:traC [Symbiodinium microadriaticum]
MAKKSKKKKSAEEVRSDITNGIVDAIKNGCPPWRQPWLGGSGNNCGWPTNFTSKRRYTGINPVVLMMSGFASKFWGTGYQWSSIGGILKGKRHEWGAHIRKGEKSTHIVFFRMIPKKDDSGQPETNSAGEQKRIPLLRTSPVFNVEQIVAPDAGVMERKRKVDELKAHAKSLRIKGYSSMTKAVLAQAIHEEIDRRLDAFRVKELDIAVNSDPDFEPAEQLMAATQADIRHGGSRAFYRRRPDDFIQLPEKKVFHTMSDYYETAFHELFHWGEDEDRVGRHKDHDYAFGELVAELGACFILTELGVPLADEMIESSQGYLKGWLDKMGGDHKYLFRASTQASKVADYLLSFVGMENAPYQHEESGESEEEVTERKGNDKFPRFVIAKGDLNRNPVYWNSEDRVWEQEEDNATVYADQQKACWEHHDLMMESLEGRECTRYIAPIYIELYGEKPNLQQLKDWLEQAVRIVVNSPQYGNGPENAVGLLIADFEETREIAPHAWSYAAIAFVLLSWAPPLALVGGGLVMLIAWINGEQVAQQTTPHKTRRFRTSRLVITVKIFVVVLGFLLIPALVMSAAGVGAPPTKLSWILGAGIVITAVFIVVNWVAQRGITDTIFRGRNEAYDQFRDSGGDPFWDGPFLSGTFNTDSDTVRYGGRPEPEYQGPQPDPNWDMQCPRCAAKIPHDNMGCWHCGYNWGYPDWEFQCSDCGVRVPTEYGCWHCGDHSMITLGTSTVMFLLGLVIGVVLMAPRLRSALDNLKPEAANYVLLGAALFGSVVVAGWMGLAAVAVAYVLFVLFGLRNERVAKVMDKLRSAASIQQRDADERAEADDDVIVQLVTDWDANDEGDGATPKGIRELALERNVLMPPNSLDRLVEAGRLQKLQSGRYRAVGFSDENTVADAPLDESSNGQSRNRLTEQEEAPV